MDAHLKTIKALSVNRTIKALEANNMKAYYLTSPHDLPSFLNSIIEPNQIVGIGGSQTLFEMGVIDWLRQQPLKLLDRYAPNLTGEEITQIYRDSFSADVYLTSSNAVTEDGALYNIDGRGNRVAAMIYGPSKVVVIVGTNKIVKDEAQAIQRLKQIAAPANAHRLDKKTPCATLGYCTDCNSSERICAHHVTMRKQYTNNRIHVVIVEGTFGY